MALAEVTPPNHPIYQVSLSTPQVKSLIDRVFPDSEVVAIEALVSGQSFNNRIYFVTLKHHTNHQLPDQVVLKIIGRFFDERKVQNEVVNLSLLKKYCPAIPAPDVVAWCDNGKEVHSALTDPDNTAAAISSQTQDHKWIMMTRMPGRKVLKEDLLGEYSSSIANQLADFVEAWQSQMPAQDIIGNFKISYTGPVTVENYHNLQYRVDGQLFLDYPSPQPLYTPLEYYRYTLVSKMKGLNTKDVFTHLRKRIAPLMETFERETVPQLPFLTIAHADHSRPYFTHQDLTPRNILLTDTPTGPIITAIVDFEWAGMFPAYEEYLNTSVKMSGDWPETFWEKFVELLASREIPAPKFGSMSSEYWTQGCDLVRLIEDTAPWWLEAGHIQGEELEKQLDVVAARVEELVKKLQP